MTTSFADPVDYFSRGHDAGPWNDAVLGMRLAAGSRWLRSTFPDIDERITDGGLDSALVTDVICTVVSRTVPIESLPMGLDSTQMTGGSYSQSLRRTNPHGDFYLTKQERRTLGYSSGGAAFSINLMPSPDRPRF